jgi:sulfide:quinone oxidoreductase
VVAGGGIAGLETIIALRDLAGERVDITLLTASPHLEYRPLSVREPFAGSAAGRLPLEFVAEDFGVELRHDSLAWVAPRSHVAFLASGDEIEYDQLVVALGARRVKAFEHATTFRGSEDSEALHGLIQDLEGELVKRIVFVVPSGVAWSLPLYELALMTARRASDMCLDGVELSIVTPEERPLAVFGPAAGDELEDLLGAAGITLHCCAHAELPARGLVRLHPSGDVLDCDRVVALPRIEGPALRGLPADADGFIPVNAHGAVRGAADVYAAGDGTDFPVKQGGLACQQADAVAEAIARRAGAAIEPRSFHPVLRGNLLTGSAPRYLRNDLSGRNGDASAAGERELWWPAAKVAGRYLAPYLESHELAGATR